ncbi:MAG: MarR family transcriptional regulator [Pseudolabrys sp.]|nr:MarR family transcriptional regulator [Pseudolabrys sp.]
MQGKAASRGETTQSLGYLSRYAHRAFVKALARELEPHGILTSQWSVLRILWGASGLTQVELADRMQVEKASLTGVLDGMEKKGLIVRTRNAKDRRKINITLTQAAKKLKDKILPCSARINGRASRGMSTAEVTALRGSLAKLIVNLER